MGEVVLSLLGRPGEKLRMQLMSAKAYSSLSTGTGALKQPESYSDSFPREQGTREVSRAKPSSVAQKVWQGRRGQSARRNHRGCNGYDVVRDDGRISNAAWFTSSDFALCLLFT